MAKSSSAVKALEKALQQLKQTEGTGKKATTVSAGDSKEETKRITSLLKESRKFGNDLIAFYDSEKGKVQNFLETLNNIESGNYKPTRGGSRKGVPRKKRGSAEAAQ